LAIGDFRFGSLQIHGENHTAQIANLKSIPYLSFQSNLKLMMLGILLRRKGKHSLLRWLLLISAALVAIGGSLLAVG
jgi:hypothetical protein